MEHNIKLRTLNFQITKFNSWQERCNNFKSTKLFTVSICYETKSIIITTKIKFPKWKGFLFDKKLTAAIVDPLIHHSHMLIFTGKSYRMANSLI